MILIPLKVLSIINISLMLILLLLFVFLLIKKTNEQKQKVRKESLKKKLRPSIFMYLSDGHEIKTRLFQKESVNFQVAQELLYEYQSRTKGDESSGRVETLAERYLAEYYRELLEHERWSIRMNTLYAIECFRIASLGDIVWEQYLEEKLLRIETVELAQQLRVLATLQSERLLKHLFKEGVVLPLSLYKEVLRKYQSHWFDQIVSQYDEAVDPLKQAILALFAEKRDPSYLPLVERELENGTLDIRMQALKVIVSFGYTSNIDKLSILAISSLWEERMMFGKVAAVLKKERFKPQLVKLIEDENWWVRNAAGEALSQYQDGDLILKHIIETNEDSFALDMAEQWQGGGKVF